MRRKNLDYLIITALLLSGLYVTITGLAADLFGLHQFALHSYAGYVCALMASVHLILNWKQVTAYLRQRFKRGQVREPPARHEPAPLLGRRGFLVSVLAAAGGFALGRLLPGRQLDISPDETADIGALYHQWSKPGYSQALGAVLEWGEWPGRYKAYDDAERIASSKSDIQII